MEKKPEKQTDKYSLPEVDRTFKYDARFEEYKAVNHTFFHILKHISSDITAEELAPKLVQDFDFKAEESLHYARTFLEKIASDLK